MENKCLLKNWFAAIVHLAILALFLGAALSARAENNCPWMNETTASDLIGGDAVGAYVVNNGKSSMCSFTELRGSKRRALQIQVESASNHQHNNYLSALRAYCGSSPIPLRAIGNESATCSIRRHGKVTGELVLGWVRNNIFIISLSTSIKGDPVLTPAMLEMKVWAAAEEVAGNLF